MFPDKRFYISYWYISKDKLSNLVFLHTEQNKLKYHDWNVSMSCVSKAKLLTLLWVLVVKSCLQARGTGVIMHLVSCNISIQQTHSTKRTDVNTVTKYHIELKGKLHPTPIFCMFLYYLKIINILRNMI